MFTREVQLFTNGKKLTSAVQLCTNQINGKKRLAETATKENFPSRHTQEKRIKLEEENVEENILNLYR